MRLRVLLALLVVVGCEAGQDPPSRPARCYGRGCRDALTATLKANS